MTRLTTNEIPALLTLTLSQLNETQQTRVHKEIGNTVDREIFRKVFSREFGLHSATSEQVLQLVGSSLYSIFDVIKTHKSSNRYSKKFKQFNSCFNRE